MRQGGAFLGERGPALLLALGLLALWQLLVTVAKVPEWILPTPLSIGASLWRHLPLLLPNALVTLLEALIGFVAAVLLGTLAALGMRRWALLERTLTPWLIASQTIPTIALAPLLMVWFGYGLTPKILIVVLLSFFPVAINTLDGLRATDPDYTRLLRTLGASANQAFWWVEVPGALPSFFSGARVAVTFSVFGAVVGEWVGSTQGLGYLIVRASSQFQTALLFASILLLSLMGIALFALLRLVEKHAVVWQEDAPAVPKAF